MSDGGRPGPRIVAGLEAAARALRAGQLETAAELLTAVEAACVSAESHNGALTAVEARQARQLFAELQPTVREAQATLASSMLQTARVRAANDAYKGD